MTVALGLGALVLASGMAAVLRTGQLQTNQNLVSDTQERAREALDLILRKARQVGVGGLTVRVARPTGPVAFPAIYHLRRPTPLPGSPGSDILMLVVPSPERRAQLATRVTAIAGGLPLACDLRSGTFADGELLLVTDLQRSVLVPSLGAQCARDAGLNGAVAVALPPPGTVEPLDSPLNQGSYVMPARMIRFEVRPDPANGDLTLVQSIMPLELESEGRTVTLARGVESLLVAYGLDTNDDGLPDLWTTDSPGGPPPAGLELAAPAVDPPGDIVKSALAGLVAVRVWLVVRSHQQLSDETGTVRRLAHTPAKIEANGPVVIPQAQAKMDGYARRTLAGEVLLRNVIAHRL